MLYTSAAFMIVNHVFGGLRFNLATLFHISYTDPGYHTLQNVLEGIDIGLYLLLVLFMLLAGVQFVKQGRKQPLAHIGGWLLIAQAVLRFVNSGLFYAGRLSDGSIATGTWCTWLFSIIVLVLGAAMICVAQHYRSGWMQAMAMLYIAAEVSLRYYVTALHYKWMSIDWPTYTLVTGILGFIILIAEVVYFFIWAKKAA